MSNDTSQELNTTNTRHKAVEGGLKPFGLETTVSINSYFLSASHRGLILIYAYLQTGEDGIHASMHVKTQLSSPYSKEQLACSETHATSLHGG